MMMVGLEKAWDNLEAKYNKAFGKITVQVRLKGLITVQVRFKGTNYCTGKVKGTDYCTGEIKGTVNDVQVPPLIYKALSD